MRLHGCCECRACTFQVALPAETVTRIDCRRPAYRRHAAAAFVAWLPAPRRALAWGTSGGCEWGERPSACEPARVRATEAGRARGCHQGANLQRPHAPVSGGCVCGAVSGGCMCGALSFTLSAGMPRKNPRCYCPQCRKTAGTPFVT